MNTAVLALSKMHSSPNSPLSGISPENLSLKVQQLVDELEVTRQQLQQCELQHYRLVEALPKIFWLADSHGSITHLNHYWYDYTGLPEGEVLKEGILQAVDPQDRDLVTHCWRQAIVHQTGFETECRLRRADDTYHWFVVQGAPVLDLEGTVLEWVGTGTNIDRLKQTEAALRKSEQKLALQVQQTPLGVIEWDLNFKVVAWNPAAKAIFGYSREEALGRSAVGMLLPENAQEVVDRIWNDLLQNRGGSRSTNENLTKDRGVIICDWYNTPLIDQDGQVLGVASLVQDVTDRHRAEAAIRQLNADLEQRVVERTAELEARAAELTRTTTVLAQTTAIVERRNQELDQFAYVVSHDLKAPLRAIANLSQWIEEDLEDYLAGETRHQMDLLRGRVHRMEALIDGLLQYSRIGRVEGQQELVAVDALLREIMDSLSPPPGFTVEMGAGMPTLRTDRLRLQQVFSNLISNAIKHHDRPHGRVWITVDDRGDRYEFTVGDDGPGIAPAYHGKVFGIFQTLQARDKVENTGIGLSLVKKIVESRGGTVQLTSEAGQGATFQFTWVK